MQLRALCLGALTCLAAPTFAATTYQFQTGPNIATIPFYSPADASELNQLIGAVGFNTVSGTFVYDSSVPQTFAINATPPSPLRPGYAGAITNLSAALGAVNISDPIGVALVADEGYFVPKPVEDLVEPYFIYDLLSLSFAVTAFPDPDLQADLLGDFRLVGFRIYWAEGLDGITDFLSSNALPGTLPPTFAGRIGMDWVNVNTNRITATFFPLVSVQPVPIGDAAILFAVPAIVTMASRRRRAKAA
ncbi:MAG: hypothetical protein H6978_08715 [Gammaproteobacteria bacterium]|nr:hypothetical protein [Gammaproteobacteria bacterium]